MWQGVEDPNEELKLIRPIPIAVLVQEVALELREESHTDTNHACECMCDDIPHTLSRKQETGSPRPHGCT